MVAARRGRVLTGRHERSSGLQGNRRGTPGNGRTAAEKPNLGPGSLLEVAQQRHHTIGLQGLVDRSNRRAAQGDHVQPEPLARLNHRVVEGTWESLSDGTDGIAECARVRAGHIP